jgi:hypothetical protein
MSEHVSYGYGFQGAGIAILGYDIQHQNETISTKYEMLPIQIRTQLLKSSFEDLIERT